MIESQKDWDEMNWKLQIPELLPCRPFLARMRDYTTVIFLMERHNSVSFTVLPFFQNTASNKPERSSVNQRN